MSESERHLIKLLPNKKAFFCEANQRVLDAGLEAGLALPFSCRGGNCGRCAAKILVGNYRYDRSTPPPGLSAEQRADGQALLCQIVPEGPLTLEIPRSDAVGISALPLVRLPCRIVRRELVAPDVMKLYLQLPRTQPLEFRPGQYLDVLLDKGQRRSYSMANLPDNFSVARQADADLPGKLSHDSKEHGNSGALGESASDEQRAARHIEIHVRRVNGGLFSTLAFDTEAGSSLLRIEGPHGQFGWRNSEQPSLLIAGGTGFAPMKAMLLEAINAQREVPVHLFWGGRSDEDLYEREELLSWQAKYPWFSFTPVVEVDTANAGSVIGRVADIAFSHYEQLSEAFVYASGPPGLVDHAVSLAKQAGVGEERLITDSFDYATS